MLFRSLRDFVAGLVLLLEDRFTIGDEISVDGLTGEVSDVNLLSTQLRGADQRVMVIPNSQCKRVVNATKLRSGGEVRLTLAHQGGDPRRALAVIEAAVAAFAADPRWSADLCGVPEVLGVSDITPSGVEVSLRLITQAGRQSAVERELRLGLLEALKGAQIGLAGAAIPEGRG